MEKPKKLLRLKTPGQMERERQMVNTRRKELERERELETRKVEIRKQELEHERMREFVEKRASRKSLYVPFSTHKIAPRGIYPIADADWSYYDGSDSE